MKPKPHAPPVPAPVIRFATGPLLGFRPTRSDLPPLNSVQPTMSSLRPEDAKTPSAPDGKSLPSAHGIRGTLLRHRRVALSAVALSVAAGAFAIGRSRHQTATVQRGAATAVLKDVGGGQHVRWHQDAIDVVVDKTLIDLAGPGVMGRVVDAWRASGAELPSISTTRGENRHIGYDPNGHNENVVVYAEHGWAKANGALAVTVLTYDDATGRILDADVLLNGGDRNFGMLDTGAAQGDAVAFESGGTTQKSTTTTTGNKKAPFDVQSVLTHELGHFFGLGEDYDDTSTTMYAKTSAGETHKRVLTQTDSGIITALYTEGAEPAADTPVKAGCGGAHFARGRATVPATTWVGWAAAVLGLGLLARSRKPRPAPLMVRVVDEPPWPRRCASSRGRLGNCGGLIVVLGFAAAAMPSEVSAASGAEVLADADVEVIAATPRWVDGVVETEVTLKLTACRVARCPEGDQRVTVAGGSLDHVTQVVGPYAVPALGTRASIDLRDGSGLMRRLGPTYGISR